MCSLTFSLSNIERHASVCGLGAVADTVKSPANFFSKMKSAASSSPTVSVTASPTAGRSPFSAGTVKRKPEESGKGISLTQIFLKIILMVAVDG